MSLFISEATARRNAALAMLRREVAAAEVVRRTVREADRSASSGFVVILRNAQGCCIGHL